jgi:hypothetical protein
MTTTRASYASIDHERRPNRESMKSHWTLRFICLGATALAVVVIAGCGTSSRPAATPAPPSAAPSSPAMPSSAPAVSPVSTAGASSSTPAATEVVAYTPYVNDAPRPGLAVSAPVSAPSCVVALHDLEPLRCIAPAGAIYDPCFPDSAGTSCLYVTAPAALTATKVLLGPAAPPQPDTSPPATKMWPGYHPAVPWAIELSGGTICVFENGAEDNIGGLRPEDRCTDGRFLFGDPAEVTAQWTVQTGASQSGPLTGAMTIERVWIFAAT